jgi:CRISPR-associated protein Cas1
VNHAHAARWSYLYLEYGTLDQASQGLVFENQLTLTSIPINQLSLVMLGPGATVTYGAVKALAGNNCLLAWTGSDGVKLYAHSTGETFSARRLLRQAQLASDENRRLEVAVWMFQKRCPSSTTWRTSTRQS